MRAPLLAVIAAAGMIAVATGCPSSSSDDTTDGGSDDGAYALVDAASLCANFTHSGDPCSPASAIICFRECITDGCQCKADKNGNGFWTCTTDFSCDPDGSPLEDSAAPPSDADTTADAGTDAGPTADGGPDAASDSSVDAATDSGSDAPLDSAMDTGDAATNPIDAQ